MSTNFITVRGLGVVAVPKKGKGPIELHSTFSSMTTARRHVKRLLRNFSDYETAYVVNLEELKKFLETVTRTVEDKPCP